MNDHFLFAAGLTVSRITKSKLAHTTKEICNELFVGTQIPVAVMAGNIYFKSYSNLISRQATTNDPLPLLTAVMPYAVAIFVTSITLQAFDQFNNTHKEFSPTPSKLKPMAFLLGVAAGSLVTYQTWNLLDPIEYSKVYSHPISSRAAVASAPTIPKFSTLHT